MGAVLHLTEFHYFSLEVEIPIDNAHSMCVMMAKSGASRSRSLMEHQNLNGLTVSRKILQGTFS